MAAKKTAKTEQADQVRILAPIPLPEFGTVLRPGQTVRLSAEMQKDERLAGKFEKV